MGSCSGRTVFVLGTGPLVEAGATVVSGQCLRTWHFAGPIIEAGHRVVLMTVPIPGATRDGIEPPVEWADYRGLRHGRLLSNDPTRILPLIEQEIESARPDAIIGVNAYPAFLLAKLDRPEPFWADLNGWTMAEGQVRAAVLGHDRDFAHFWRLEALTILRADRISTVTERQAWALYGELAMLGRLDHRTFAEDFAHAVPNAVYPDYAALERGGPMPAILQGRAPEDACAVLWSGGFNSWTNLEMLNEGMAAAMKEEPTLHFVCTGGAIHGHDEETWKRFVELSDARLPAGRCHRLGWIDYPDVLALHAWAACGINIDGTNTETRFGARNRLTNMLGAGVPVLTTAGTEIAEWIAQRGAGEVIAPRSAAGLAHALLNMARNQAAWEQRAIDARLKARSAFAPAATLLGLLNWLAEPTAAADKGAAPAGDSPAAALRRWALEQCHREVPFAAASGEGVVHDTTTGPGGALRSSGLWRAIRSLRGK